MSTAQVRVFEAQLAAAEKLAAERLAVPELSAEEILEGFQKQRELKSADVEGFGRIYYRHPMTAAERFEILAKLENGETMTARDLAQIIIARALKADGTLKFAPAHIDALLQAPAAAFEQLAGLLFRNRVTLASAEKK